MERSRELCNEFPLNLYRVLLAFLQAIIRIARSAICCDLSANYFKREASNIDKTQKLMHHNSILTDSQQTLGALVVDRRCLARSAFLPATAGNRRCGASS